MKGKGREEGEGNRERDRERGAAADEVSGSGRGRGGRRRRAGRWLGARGSSIFGEEAGAESAAGHSRRPSSRSPRRPRRLYPRRPSCRTADLRRPLSLPRLPQGAGFCRGRKPWAAARSPRRSCVGSAPVLRVAAWQVIDYLNSSPNVKDCQVE